GRLTPVVEDPAGFHVIKVVGERPEGAAPLAEVEGSIRSTLELEGAQKKLEAEATRLRGEITEASRLEEVARSHGLTVKTRFAPTGSPLREIGASPDFVAALSKLQPNEVSAPLTLASGLAIVTAEAVQPPQVAPFEEVRDTVRKDLLDERGRKAAVATA